jgi:hypothetical protein
VIVGLFEAAPGFEEFLRGTGIIDEDRVHRTDRIAQLWGYRDDRAAIVAQMAAWAGVEKRDADDALRRSGPFFESWFSALDAAAQRFRDAGHPDPVAHLQWCMDWGQPAPGRVEDALAGAHEAFERTQIRRFEQDSVARAWLRRR